jgi:Fur family ferric uptake transcriptional regulator
MHESLSLFNEYLQRRNLRLTAQRQKVAVLVLNQVGHLSAEDIAAAARQRHLGVGRSTVYRTLDLLCDSGLVQPVDLGGDARLFETMVSREHHDHLRCTSCGAIFEFESPAIEALQKQIARARGFRIVSHRHEIFGLCRNCAASDDDTARGAPRAYGRPLALPASGRRHPARR